MKFLVDLVLGKDLDECTETAIVFNKVRLLRNCNLGVQSRYRVLWNDDLVVVSSAYLSGGVYNELLLNTRNC